MGGTGRTFLTLSLSSNLISNTLFSSCTKHHHFLLPKLLSPPRVLLGFRPLCSSTTLTSSPSNPSILESDEIPNPTKQSILLERLRLRHLKEGAKTPQPKTPSSSSKSAPNLVPKKGSVSVSGFGDLGLREEVMAALDEMGISVPTEIQCIGIPSVLEGQSVVLGSHTGSGKTLAYLLPVAQLLKRDEEISGIIMKPRRPRAVILSPTRELAEQVFRVAKSISHHARFRSTMVSGGGRLRPQEDSLNVPIDMVVGTPGRILQHIEEGNMVYGDIKYVVLDEADTMFDHGFGPEIRKFLGPLKNRASRPDDPGFQTVLVAATMTQAVQKLIDEEFEGIVHLRTSTLHKKVASARHDFIKLTGSENKMEALLQVLEPSLAKGNKVMVFCNTLNSSRAVDHFLTENQIYTVNYHGEVPAEERVQNLKKFKDEDGSCPTLVCTDLAARGLDLDVDHVIMFDFPKNSVDYLHRTGRTARMGAKGKVTSLITKRDMPLANRIEEAMKKNESLESLSVDSIRRDIARSKITPLKGTNSPFVKTSTVKTFKGKGQAPSIRSSSGAASKMVSATWAPAKKTFAGKSGKTSSQSERKFAKKTLAGKSEKTSSQSKGKPAKKHDKVSKTSTSSPSKKSTSKISVVGFRGRSSSSN